jgi:hypothetical protein
MHDQSMKSMTVENVNQFDVWIRNSQNLVVSIVPVDAPWAAASENYEIDQTNESCDCGKPDWTRDRASVLYSSKRATRKPDF